VIHASPRLFDSWLQRNCHLGNYYVTHNDLRSSCRGTQDVIPDLTCSLLVGSKRLNTSYELFDCALFYLVSSDAAEHGPTSGLFNALFLDRVSPKCHTLTQTAIG
jgi:hypothetical protein